MRRAVARVNEPCPCGSGKKYKHCCIAKDQERLHRSSDVAGVTHEELFAKLEDHLTAERIEKIEPYGTGPAEPRENSRRAVGAYFLRLAAFNLLDRARRRWKFWAVRRADDGGWNHVMLLAARAAGTWRNG